MFYYLDNFRTALDWLTARYADLLATEERSFVTQFEALPRHSQALLVRLLMRKGELFRDTKIVYPEIGDIVAAVAPLIEAGWLDADPELSIDELFAVLRRGELALIFPMLRSRALKAAALETLRPLQVGGRTLGVWFERGTSPHAIGSERVYRVRIAPLCLRLRLLFFGNYRQDWREFVLADLQIFRYEAVTLSPQSRAFQSRQEIEQFYALHTCRELLADDATTEQVLAHLPAEPFANDWLEARRAKLMFHVAHNCERRGESAQALELYRQCSYPGARVRRLRVLERRGDYGAAVVLAEAAAAHPENEAEQQQLPRVLSRLRRQLSLPALEHARLSAPARLDIVLVAREPPQPVEYALLTHLSRPEAPVYYVENALINSLFGLLCWEAIFAPLSGAFFHPFHAGPADLHSPHFLKRRQPLFAQCLRRLEDASYREQIRRTYDDKQGIQSPFVFWGALDDELLETALHCIPPRHLRHCFERLLADLRDHCAGLPDLIQFWPQERRYRLIEVKGPNDRLQDNQRRWLAFCQSVEIPVAVCHVRWAA